MKTQLRIRSLRNLVVSAIVAASLNIAVSAQPNPDRSSLTLSDMERLEIFADRIEQSLKYVAPDDNALDMEKEEALKNLELFAENSESTLKYMAPVKLEDQIDQQLEILADNMMEQLVYEAPVYDEFTNTFTEKPVMSTLKSNTRPVLTEDCTPQEAWLISSGYYKNSKKSSIQKVKSEEFMNKHADEL
ncbi:MAG TPA: hypothetical protein VHI78_13390 [Bacteroidales bacterium]|jgi:hypothetical protein|nr:hypothetical protein [Bacteroidales bacterium]